MEGGMGWLWVSLYVWKGRMGVCGSISLKVGKFVKNVKVKLIVFGSFTLFVSYYSALSNLRRYGETQH